VLLLVTGTVEYHEAVVARLLTLTTWVPVAAPVVADAVAMLEFDEDGESEENELSSELKSVSTVLTSPLMVVRSDPSPCSVVCCACHCTSGARAAVTAALTAAVTSMPSELEPSATSNSELKSMPSEEEEDVELDPSSEDKLDEDRPTELIAQPP
jgi:hypothetical protein